MIKFNPKIFNPLYWHVIDLIWNHAIRYIHIEGGSSAAKTFSICQAIVFYTISAKRNAVVFRRFHVHIKDTVYASFKSAIAKMQLTDQYIFQEDLIIHKQTNAKIAFKGLDNEENVKGLEDYDIVYVNEWNQTLIEHWKQLRKRLRGRKNQKFITDWNPVSAKMWLYTDWIDLEKWTDLPVEMLNVPTKYSSLDSDFAFKRINAIGNMVNIKVTYRDNFWVMGHPSGKGGFDDVETKRDFEKDRVTDPAYYRVYANGERGIIKTGGEFWKHFENDKHVHPVIYQPAPLHITVDVNSIPYVTVALWQLIGQNIRQVHELPCKYPDNNSPKAARKLVEWLRRIEHKDVIFLYGDPSSKKASTVDENSKSFYEKFEEELNRAGFKVINRVIKSAPEVVLSAAFINEIYEFSYNGWSITISDSCKVSIEDYIIVKEAPDGTMVKPTEMDTVTKKKYETHGHFSDAKRYLIIELLKEEWKKYKTKKAAFINQLGYLR